MPWRPGQSGNPAGRPSGSRDKITEAFLRDLADDWKRHGKEAIQRVYDEDPVAYVRLAASLVPREHRLSSELNIVSIIQTVSERQQQKLSEAKTIEHRLELPEKT